MPNFEYSALCFHMTSTINLFRKTEHDLKKNMHTCVILVTHTLMLMLESDKKLWKLEGV